MGAIDNEDPRASTAALIIAALSTKNGRIGAGVKNATIVFSGLGDTVDVIGDLGSFGLDEEPLAAMTRDECKTLMLRELETGCGKDKQLANTIAKAWVPTMLDLFGDWTRHAAAGAQALKNVTRKMGRKSIEGPEGWAATVSMGMEIRAQLYRAVRKRATKHEVPVELVETLGQAMLRNDGLITERQAQTLAIRIQQAEDQAQGFESGSRDEQIKHAKQTLRACLRAGLLDRVNDETSRHFGKLYSPIPSLTSALTRNPDTPMNTMMGWLQAAGLQTEEANTNETTQNGKSKPKKP